MIGVLRTDLVPSMRLATSGQSDSVSPPRSLAMGRSPVRGRGYSYYTTCMIGINSVGKITYNDLYPAAYNPNRSYVVSLVANGQGVDLMPPPTTGFRRSTIWRRGPVAAWPDHERHAVQNSSRTKTTINQLKASINLVEAQSGKHITADAAAVLIADAQWVIAHLQ